MASSLVTSLLNVNITSFTQLKKIEYVCTEFVKEVLITKINESIMTNLDGKILFNHKPLFYTYDCNYDHEFTSIDVTFIECLKDDVNLFLDKMLFKYIQSKYKQSDTYLCINVFLLNNSLVITCRELFV